MLKILKSAGSSVNMHTNNESPLDLAQEFTIFYNNSVKKWLKDNNTEMCLIHNEGKSVVAELFVRTLKTKIYKCMTSISKKYVYQ